MLHMHRGSNDDRSAAASIRSARGLAVGSLVLAVIGVAVAVAGNRGGKLRFIAIVLPAMMFLHAGLVLVAARRAYQRETRLVQLKELHPTAPWMWNESWSQGVAASSRKNMIQLGAMFSATLVAVVAAMAADTLPLSGDTSKGLRPLIVLSVMALGCIGWMLHEALRWRRYGFSTFEITPVPGAVGCELRGFLRLKSLPPSGSTFTLSLKCNCFTGRQNGQIWESVQKVEAVAAQVRADGYALPVVFQIPKTCEASADGKRQITWSLNATTGARPLSYVDSFEVPIFHLDTPATRVMRPTSDAPVALPAGSEIVSSRTDSGEVSISIVGKRNALAARPGAKVARGALVIAFVGQMLLDQIWHWTPSIWWALASFAVILALIAVREVLLMRVCTTITLGHDDVRIQYKLWRIKRQESVARSAITAARAKTAQVVAKTQTYDVELVGGEGSIQDIGVMLHDEKEAEWLACEINRELARGRPGSSPA